MNTDSQPQNLQSRARHPSNSSKRGPTLTCAAHSNVFPISINPAAFAVGYKGRDIKRFLVCRSNRLGRTIARRDGGIARAKT